MEESDLESPAFRFAHRAKPVVKFSLDPKRLFTKRMVGRGDEPILLDGETTLGDPKCLLAVTHLTPMTFHGMQS